MSLALPFALLALGGGFIWAATRKPPKPGTSAPPLALPPGPPMSPATPDGAAAASAPPMLDQAQQILTQYALDPGMPPALAGQVARVLSAEGDPAKLDSWAAKLDQLNFAKAAQALRAKANALRAVAGAGAALGQIHDVLQGPSGAIPTDTGPPITPPLSATPSPSGPPSAPQPPGIPSTAPPFASMPPFASSTPPSGSTAPPSVSPGVSAATGDPAALAQLVADDIRAKGCWHENRDLVKQFQRLVYPAAGGVDGFYGPQVALAMAKYIPKVPPPCYWPKAPADRARAKAAWTRMVKAANVNVGRASMGGQHA